MINIGLIVVAGTVTLLLAGCGTVKEKTAPCKRPAALASFTEDPRRGCGSMRPVNDPQAAFTAIGLRQQQQGS